VIWKMLISLALKASCSRVDRLRSVKSAKVVGLTQAVDVHRAVVDGQARLALRNQTARCAYPFRTPAMAPPTEEPHFTTMLFTII